MAGMWPEEYEELRAEARSMVDSIIGAYTSMASGPVPTDLAGRVAQGRALLTAMEVTSPAGTDEEVAGVPCRVFRPPSGASRGTYLHLHGGAMIYGSPRMNDLGNEALCQRLRVTVVSVDYRLAPEHPFPAGSDDCLAVAKWVLDHEDGPIVVGGESAGGYFAAQTLLRIRDDLDAIGRVAAANLVFGVYDLSGTPSGLGYRPTDVPDLLAGDLGDMVVEACLPGRTRFDARAPEWSPLYAGLHGMPPALFTVGSADHLLDDSLFMYARWRTYGGDAELAVYPDCPHGFVGFPFALAAKANERIEAFLDAAFSR